jgi:hypothetical protein
MTPALTTNHVNSYRPGWDILQAKKKRSKERFMQCLPSVRTKLCMQEQQALDSRPQEQNEEFTESQVTSYQLVVTLSEPPLKPEQAAAQILPAVTPLQN